MTVQKNVHFIVKLFEKHLTRMKYAVTVKNDLQKRNLVLHKCYSCNKLHLHV